MYKILVVDDERVEREGIRFLIEDYHLPLDVVEAVNGKAALEYLTDHEVDILLTDIKMPLMDGLELASRARELKRSMKIIIFSAYGEFDYAKKAINLNVAHYLLKPLVIDEFLQVMSKIIQLCQEEEDKKKRDQLLLEGYHKGVGYEREKALLDLLNGVNCDDELLNRLNSYGIDFNNKYIQLMMIDFQSRFFDTRNDEFSDSMKEIIQGDFEYVNINERQSVIFLVYVGSFPDRRDVAGLAEDLVRHIHKKYALSARLVISHPTDDISEICRVYEDTEQTLEYKYFFNDQAVLFTWQESSDAHNPKDLFEKMVEGIYKYIDESDYENAVRAMVLLFQHLKGKENFSAIYVKYICMEIVKRIHKKSESGNEVNFHKLLEDVFNSKTLSQLNDLMIGLLRDISEQWPANDEEANKKVIRDILHLIHNQYMKDLNLEAIAESVYLSPGHISRLFKKNTGQSLVKYITAYRLEKAKELLQNTNMKIVDVAEKVGYSNNSYFCMAFRNYFGMSPAKYRGKEE